MATIRSAKTALRREMKKRLANISAESKNYQSQIISEKILLNQVYKKSKRISIYINTDEEVRTNTLLEDIFATGKTCYVPRFSFDKIFMEMLRVHSLEDLRRLPIQKWNIKQPSVSEIRENALNTGGLDLIFVPGLAFTKEGQRLGRGKGYYDTFVRECGECQDAPPITMGLSFKEQLCSYIPTDIHDVMLDHVIYCNGKGNA